MKPTISALFFLASVVGVSGQFAEITGDALKRLNREAARLVNATIFDNKKGSHRKKK